MVPFYILVLLQCYHVFLLNATLVIRYKNATSDLRERLQSGRQDSDILLAFSMQEKEALCKEVLAAREYVMVPPPNVSRLPISGSAGSSEQNASSEDCDVENPNDEKEVAEILSTKIGTEALEDSSRTISNEEVREDRSSTPWTLTVDASQKKDPDIIWETIEGQTHQALPAKTSPQGRHVIQEISPGDRSHSIRSDNSVPETDQLAASQMVGEENKLSIEGEDVLSSKVPRRKRSFNPNMKMDALVPSESAMVVVSSISTSGDKGTKMNLKFKQENLSFRVENSPTSSTKGKGILYAPPFKTPSAGVQRKVTSSSIDQTVSPKLSSQLKSLLQTWSPQELPKRPTEFKSRYKRRPVRLPGRKTMEAYSIKCAEIDGKHLFIMYGLRRTDLFLLENRPFGKRLSTVTALITQTPYVNLNYYKSKALLTSFLQQLEIGDDEQLQVPRNMTLCFLKKSAHLRLCAATFDGLVASGIFASDALPVNSVTVDSHERCLVRTVRLNADVSVKYVPVVPCSVNRASGYADSQYYVLPDLKGTASAFVLTGKKDSVEVTVVAAVEHVDILFEIHFYSEFRLGTPSTSFKKRKPQNSPTTVSAEHDGRRSEE